MSKENDWSLEQDIVYNRLTAFKLFAMTSSMVISVNELAPFGKTGPTALFYLLIAGLSQLPKWPAKWRQLTAGPKAEFSLG